MASAAELDGYLVTRNRRLLKLTIREMFSFAIYYLFKGADADTRKRIWAALQGRLGENGGIMVDDPDLPESLQGLEAPSWWSEEQPMPSANDYLNIQ